LVCVSDEEFEKNIKSIHVNMAMLTKKTAYLDNFYGAAWRFLAERVYLRPDRTTNFFLTMQMHWIEFPSDSYLERLLAMPETFNFFSVDKSEVRIADIDYNG